MKITSPRTLIRITLFLIINGNPVQPQGDNVLIKRPASSVINPPPKSVKVDDEAIVLEKLRTLDIMRENLDVSIKDVDVLKACLGHGGSYDAVKPVVSRLNVIESDHAPHYSILDYAENVNNLPPKIKEIVDTRKELKKQLDSTDYAKNEEKITKIANDIKLLEKELNPGKPIRVQKWDKELKKEYNKNNREITKLLKQNKALSAEKGVDPGKSVEIEGELRQNINREKQLLARNSELRNEAVFRATGKNLTPDPVKLEELNKLVKEQNSLVDTNKVLSHDLDTYNAKVKGKMGVLSIPYEIHRKFPSTGKAGVNDEIQSLRTATAAEVKIVMNKYADKWMTDMQDGIDNKQFKNAGDHIIGKNSAGKNIYDYQKIWETNFQEIFDEGKKTSAANKANKGKSKPSVVDPREQFVQKIRLSYAKKFMTNAIYIIKTPTEGYSRLLGSYLNEYRIFLNNDIDDYKIGMQNLLKANAEFGWIDDANVGKLIRQHDLDDIKSTADPKLAAVKENAWNKVEEFIKFEASRNTDSAQAASISGASTSSITCSTGAGTRKRRSVGSNCIFFVRNKDTDVDTVQKQPNIDGGDDMDKTKSIVPDRNNGKLNHGDEPSNAIPKQKLDTDGNVESFKNPTIFDDTVPAKSFDVDEIDSKQLSKLLSSSEGVTDADNQKTRRDIVDLATRNQDKLVGTDDEIKKVKAQLAQENLEAHANQNSLARSTLKNLDGETTKSVSRFQKVKISMTKVAARATKFTDGTSKVSNKYGKIMLAKGVVTALRHGDVESLAIMGGRIGLEYALKGVEKLGGYIAKKATTKFVTKLGSNVLGKMAGPVGAVADIGINIWSITKSVKVLNNPNASKFDQNDAIADIVADSIDIAITATAAVLSLVFPPLAPVFAAVAFIINVLTTLVVGFYKAANHVDRVNSQLPLLDYEKSTEYFRYFTGSETSTYIQELIDTKTANNIVVNLTVQFLQNNPDYIGKISPSRTYHNPAGDCYLEEKLCGKIFHFIPLPCDWQRKVKCDGANGRCYGDYSNMKCRADSGTGAVVPILGHDKLEWRCNCESDPPPVWRHEIPDSIVDLREKKAVYQQRASPDFELKSGFRYLCKPSSLSFEGDRVSKRSTSIDYHCYGAFGIERYPKSGKFLLIDLGMGDDRVDLNESDTTDTLFVVGDGVKNFFGGGGDDTFVIDGQCNNLQGTLDGKRYKKDGNTVIVGQNCSTTSIPDVNLQAGSLSSSGGFLSLRNIQKVIGRSGKPDRIRASCTTTFISGGGGSGVPDEISIPRCSSSLSLTVLALGNSYLNFEDFMGGNVYVLIQNFNRFSANNLGNNLGSGTILFKMEGALSTASVDSSGNISFFFEKSGTASFTFRGEDHASRSSMPKCSKMEEPEGKNKPQFIIVPPGSNQLERHILYNFESKSLHSIIKLDGTNITKTVVGYSSIDNIFQLVGPGRWTAIIGGERDDQFHLSGSSFFGQIDGRGGQNTLLIMPSISHRVVIDLPQGLISARVDGNVTVANVQRVIGRRLATEEVTVDCHTSYVDLNGGSSSPDSVTIPRQGCPHNVQINAKGKLTVKIMDGKDTDKILITASPPDECGKIGENFELSILTEEQIFSISNSAHVTIYEQPDNLVRVDGTRLFFKGGNSLVIVGAFPTITLQHGGKHYSSIVQIQGGQLMILHELNSEESRKLERNGAKVLPNIFKLISGIWQANGGEMEDRFILETVGNVLFEIDGMAGKNSFIVGESVPGQVEIDMINGHLRNATRENQIIGKIRNVHSFSGRSGVKEILIAGCDTEWISLGGGGQIDFDLVQVPKTFCTRSRRVSTIAVGTTEYFSSTVDGVYQVYIHPDEENRVRFRSNLFLGDDTMFTISVEMSSYKLSDYRVVPSTKETRYEIQLLFIDHGNYVNFNLDFHGVTGTHKFLPNFTVMFIDSNYSSNGNLLVDMATGDVQILHVLEGNNATRNVRRGATGASNVFRLNSGLWEVHGGKRNDAFVINGGVSRPAGKLNGHGGVNSLVLMDSAETVVEIDLLNRSVKFDTVFALEIENIQRINGIKGKRDLVKVACDTKLVVLEGGESLEKMDIITVPPSFCSPTVSFVLEEFTTIRNFATRGNFTYHVKTVEEFSITYQPTNNTGHAFKFEFPLESVTNVKLVNRTDHLEMITTSGKVQYFPLNFHKLPTFHIGQDDRLVTELRFQESGDISAVTEATNSYSGDIIGICGAENDIIIKTGENLNKIIGGDLNDNIFLAEVQTIWELDGGLGTNQVQFVETLYPGVGLEIDLREEIGAIYFLDGQNESNYENEEFFVMSLKNFGIFQGREISFDKVVLGCGTQSVKNADLVVIHDVNCVTYEVRIYVGVGTRVVFELDDKVFFENDENKGGIDNATELPNSVEIKAEESDIETDNVIMQIVDDNNEYEESTDDDEIDRKVALNSSNFYYHFTTVKNFDIETTDFHRLWKTRHIFILNFTLSELTRIHFAESRLIYGTHSGGNVSFSHLVVGVDPTEMFYSQPEFITGDGFLIRITRNGEILISFGNLDENLDLEKVQTQLIPRLAGFAARLSVSFVIETKSDFIYCGNENEVNIFTNRVNLTSHLVGFNQSTYVIFDLARDTYIYPKNVGENSLHVVDLSEIVHQIRNTSGTKYVPSIHQIGADLVIKMANYEDIYPSSVIIVNGTLSSNWVRVLLNSVVMDIVRPNEILDIGESGRIKRDMVGDNAKYRWGIVPRPVEIPKGFVYLLAAEDLEDGIEIRVKGRGEIWGNSSFQHFAYSRENSDLLVTNVQGIGHSGNDGEATSFIIWDYFDNKSDTSIHNKGSSAFGLTSTVNNVTIRLGDKTALVSSARGGPIDAESEAEIQLEYYEDILERVEQQVLKDFPEIERKFEVPLIKKMGRNGLLRRLFWGGVFTLVSFLGWFVWVFLRKKEVTGEYVVETGRIEEGGEQIPLIEIEKVGKEAELLRFHKNDMMK